MWLRLVDITLSSPQWVERGEVARLHQHYSAAGRGKEGWEGREGGREEGKETNMKNSYTQGDISWPVNPQTYLEQVNLFDAVLPSLCVHHLKDLKTAEPPPKVNNRYYTTQFLPPTTLPHFRD